MSDHDNENLFGSEDEEEVLEPAANKSRETEAPPKADEDDDDIADLFGDSDDEVDNRDTKAAETTSAVADVEVEREKEQNQEEEQGLSEDARLRLGLGTPRHVSLSAPIGSAMGRSGLCAVKLPGWMELEPAPFDKDALLNELSAATHSELAAHAAPHIRWRYAHDNTQARNKIRQSNAQLVKWSDGSRQLMVGSEVFDVRQAKLDANQHFLYVESDGLLQCQAHFDTKLMVQSKKSWVGKTSTRKPLPSQTSIKHMVTTVDPEIEKEKRGRLHLEQEALQRRQQRKVERTRPAYRLPDFNTDFLEDDYGDESSGEERRPPNRAGLARRRYSDDEDSEHSGDANRLEEAKRSAAVVKGKAVVKKRQRRPISPLPQLSDDEMEEEQAPSNDGGMQQTKRSGPKRRRVFDSDSE